LRKIAKQKKWVTLGKMGHSWKKDPQLEKWVKFREWVTLGKISITCMEEESQ